MIGMKHRFGAEGKQEFEQESAVITAQRGQARGCRLQVAGCRLFGASQPAIFNPQPATGFEKPESQEPAADKPAGGGLRHRGELGPEHVIRTGLKI